MIYPVPRGLVEITGVSCRTVHDGSSARTHHLTISWTTVENFPDQMSCYVVSMLPLESTWMEMAHEIRPGGVQSS